MKNLSGRKSSFDRIAIVGVGLIGGSLGLAIKKHFPLAHITGFDRREVLRKALKRGRDRSSINEPPWCSLQRRSGISRHPRVHDSQNAPEDLKVCLHRHARDRRRECQAKHPARRSEIFSRREFHRWASNGGRGAFWSRCRASTSL